MLARHEGQHLEQAGALQGRDDGRHLVRLRPRAEGDDDARTRGRSPAHAGAPSRRTSARRASETAAMRTTVRNRATNISSGGVAETSIPATPKANVAGQRRSPAPRVDPQRP